MKKVKFIISLLFVFFVCALVSAQEKPISKIKVAARYTTNASIELRFFPDRKRVLEIGLKEGFIIERKRSGSNSFVEIGRTMVFTESQWEQAIASAKNATQKESIEIAYDFYQEIGKSSGSTIDMTHGIANLKEQKAKEDFEFMVFMLTAIQEPVVAEALGLSFVDKSVQEGQTYQYRIALQGKIPVYKIEAIPTIIKASTQIDRYKNKVYTKIGDTKLSFVWIETPYLSGYDVERAKGGSNEFVQLNKAPIYTLTGKKYKGQKRSSFEEDSLTNYQKYTYRFFGYTAFGERIQFAELEAMPRDLTPPQQPFLMQPKHIKPDEVLIEWKMNTKIASDFKGFAISRSDNNKGNFVLINDKLLPKNARKFIDKSFVKGKTNYYLIQALDTANNVSSSFPVAVTLIDSVPPKRPVFVKGKMDSLGIVTLDIKKNKETDLMGYRLYRSNGEKHEFSAIQEGFMPIDSIHKTVQTQFKDTVTLKSLTPYVYYQVEALDFNHNTSRLSTILKVKRPDKIPPTTPLFKNVKVNQDTVTLEFILSNSTDVEEHILFRKLDLNAAWEKLTVLKKEQQIFIDKNLKKGTKYYYTLRAKDDSGNYSEYALSVMGKPYDNGVRPPVLNLKLVYKENKVTLSWKYPHKNDKTFYVIYKKNQKGHLVQYNNTLDLYFQESAKKGDTYAVKVFTQDGGQSKISELISIK